MKKIISVLFLGAIGLTTLWSITTSPKIGHIVFENATDTEARVYGFDQKQVDIGELTMSLYESTRQKNKPALILLHGYSADKDVWPRFARHLSDDFHILIPDMAGHGDTGFNAQWNYSAPQQAKRILALMDALNIEKAHLIGNSMGGFISAHFAKSYPERTLSATLIDPAGVRSPEPSDMEKMLTAGRNPFEIHNRKEFDEFYAMTMERPPWLPGFVLAAISEKYQARRPELLQIFNDFHSKNMLDTHLNEIQVPVLLLWGKLDRLIHFSSSTVWQAGIPNIQIVTLDGIGHMPMLEAPKRTALLYRQFAEGLSKDEKYEKL